MTGLYSPPELTPEELRQLCQRQLELVRTVRTLKDELRKNARLLTARPDYAAEYMATIREDQKRDDPR